MNGSDALREVAQTLREVHKLLLAVLKKEREQAAGKNVAPAEWFQILLNEPEYKWMKGLNSLVSDTDALSELTKISDQDLAILRYEVEKFFFVDDEDVTSFNSHYRKLFNLSHDIMYS